MSKLLNFLTDLAIDPDRQEIFAKNPEAVVKTADLSTADKAALQSRDKAKIVAAFVDELQTNELEAVMGSCIIGDPGPDPSPDPDPPEPPAK